MRVFYLILFVSFWTVASSQIDRESDEVGITNVAKQSVSDTLELVQDDTLSNALFTFDLSHITKYESWVDTSIQLFHEYEYGRQQNELWATTGNIGSSAFPIFYEPIFKEGFELGHRQHRLYQFKQSDIRFYNLEKPYSQVYFTPGNSQSSFRSSALLARDFSDNVKLTIDFDRINAENYYVNQEVRHTHLHLGVYQRIDSTRWAYAVNFLSNSNYEAYNGGITDYTKFNIDLNDIRTNIPVALQNAYSYSLSRLYSGNAYYFLQDKKEVQQYLSVELTHDRSLYKYIDKSISKDDSLYYSNKYIPSSLGLRLHNVLNTSKIGLGYHLSTQTVQTYLYGKYSIHQLTTDLDKQSINDAIVGGETNFAWRGLSIDVDGFIGVSQGYAISNLHPKASFQYKDWLDILLGIRFHIRPPDYVENQLVLSSVEIYDNDFGISTIQELHGEIGIPKIGLSAGFRSIASQNVIYYNSNSQAFESENQVNMLRFFVGDELKLKWLVISNYFITQTQNVQVYNMPNWYSRHGIAFDGFLFDKNLKLNTGVNVDYFPAYSLPAYQPIVSSLYFNDGVPWNRQYRLDAHLSVFIKGLRFFIKYENIADFWSDEILFQVKDYPQQDGKLRLGASWILRN